MDVIRKSAENRWRAASPWPSGAQHPSAAASGKVVTKRAISIRLDPAVPESYKALGRGWQGRMNDTLAKHAPQLSRQRRLSRARG